MEFGDTSVGGHQMRTLTGWTLWRWPLSPAPGARLCETDQSASCRCGPESEAARPGRERLSACCPVSTIWSPLSLPSPAVPEPMGLPPWTTSPQVWCRDPAALLPGRSAPPCPCDGRTGGNLWNYTWNLSGSGFGPRNILLETSVADLQCHLTNSRGCSNFLKSHRSCKALAETCTHRLTECF